MPYYLEPRPKEFRLETLQETAGHLLQLAARQPYNPITSEGNRQIIGELLEEKQKPQKP